LAKTLTVQESICPLDLSSLLVAHSLTILTMALSVGFIRFVILREHDPS